MSPLSFLAVACALAACANGALVREIKLPSLAVQQSSFALAHHGLGTVRVSSESEIDGQIVGGRDALPGEFPHQVSMQVVMPGFLWFDADPQHICGGTLIAENWVLTAAHCVHGVPSTSRRVDAVVGITDLTKNPAGSQRITVSRMLAHEKYDPTSNSGVGPWDIALLKLSSSAKLGDTVKLGLLPTSEAIPTGDATLSGWGSTSMNGNRPVYPNKLQTAVFPIVAFDDCYKFVSDASPGEPNPLLDTSNLCVGPLDRTGLSSCSGDSGGPLIQKQGNDAVVIGVVSWGLRDCGKYPFPSVYTRVSGFNSWLNAALSQY